MGGLEIDADSRVVKKVGNNMVAIDGLYAAGEIAGGVHGNNRLGGNSLLDCVVFGRVAGPRLRSRWMAIFDFIDLPGAVVRAAPARFVASYTRIASASRFSRISANR